VGMSEYHKLWERLVTKITSARYILTLIVALVFAYMAIKGTLDANRVIEIVLVVFYAYFTKNRDQVPTDTTTKTTSQTQTTSVPGPDKK